MQNMVMTILLLHIGFSSRCIKLFRPLSNKLVALIRQPSSAFFKRILGKIASFPYQFTYADSIAPLYEPFLLWHTVWKDVIVIPLFGLFLAIRLFADLTGSMLVEVSH
jgi:hypothetical protein